MSKPRTEEGTCLDAEDGEEKAERQKRVNSVMCSGENRDSLIYTCEEEEERPDTRNQSQVIHSRGLFSRFFRFRDERRLGTGSSHGMHYQCPP